MGTAFTQVGRACASHNLAPRSARGPRPRPAFDSQIKIQSKAVAVPLRPEPRNLGLKLVAGPHQCIERIAELFSDRVIALGDREGQL